MLPQEGWDNIAQNLRVERALLPVLDLLSDLPVVVFKGGLLTRMLHGNLSGRSSVDNDLWIPSPHTNVALERLLSRGYGPVAGLDAHKALGRDGQVALWPTEGEAFEVDVGVDLHAFPFSTHLFEVEEKVLWEHVVQAEIHGTKVQSFDPALALCHLVAHYVQHRLDAGHLPDVRLALERWQLSEAVLRDLAKQTCTEEAFEFAATLALAGTTGAKRPGVTTARARALLWLTNGGTRMGGETTARILSLCLAAPQHLPREVYRGLVLEDDQFLAQGDEGRSLSAILRRVREMLARG